MLWDARVLLGYKPGSNTDLVVQKTMVNGTTEELVANLVGTLISWVITAMLAFQVSYDCNF